MKFLQSVLLLVTIICSVLNTVHAQNTKPFPQVAKSYRSVVSGNFDENGYTLGYIEAYDGDKDLLRTKGRFSTSLFEEQIDLKNNVFYNFNAYDSTPCKKFDITDRQASSPMIGPSRNFFNFVNATKSEYIYLGQNTDARGILCDVFQISRFNNVSRRGHAYQQNFTITYYFKPAEPDMTTQVPVRAVLNGVRTNMSDPNKATKAYTHYYDWAKFEEYPYFDDQVFALPERCIANPVASKLPPPIVLPQSNTVAPQPALNASNPLPTLPRQFFTVIESKLDDININQNWGIRWYVDLDSKQERVDYVNLDDAPIIMNRYIYNYAKGYAYMYDGMNGCQTQLINDQNKNILSRLRAGSLPALFSDTTTFFQQQQPVYIGRKLARGVMADVWTAPVVKGNYNFTMELYFYPQGWQFPGRSIAANERVLMRIINTGSFKNGTNNVSYQDIIDNFLFYPSLGQFGGVSTGGVFDPVALNCPVQPNTANDKKVPILPTQYSVLVAANIVEKGYTLSFKETYDGSIKKLKTIGKFRDFNNVEIIDFNTNTSISWNLYNTSVAYTSTLPAILLTRTNIHPTVNTFRMINSSALTYYGQTTSVRSILCDHWKANTITRIRNGIQYKYDITYYATATNVLYNQPVPVRILLKGSYRNISESNAEVISYQHAYDWIGWTTVPTKSFDVPTNVTLPGTAPSSISLPQTSTVVAVDQLPNPYPFPSYPAQFTTQIEAKLSGMDIFTLQWSVDQSSKMERVDVYNKEQSMLLYSYLYKYTDMAQNIGYVYALDVVKGACNTINTQDEAALSPLSKRLRNSLIPNMITETAMPTCTYTGRVERRGVDADTWVVSMNTVKETYTNNFNRSCMYYPKGWQFPSRISSTDTTMIPLAIMQSGTYADIAADGKTTTIPYDDAWDFFYFKPVIADPSTFDMTSFSSCPAILPAAASSSSSLSKTAIILGVIGAVVVLVGGIWAYTKLQKWWNERKYRQRLEDRDTTASYSQRFSHLK